jgi:hypothetical protein
VHALIALQQTALAHYNPAMKFLFYRLLRHPIESLRHTLLSRSLLREQKALMQRLHEQHMNAIVNSYITARAYQ